MKTIVFDIDGTLSNVGHREHLVRKYPKDFDAFYQAMDKDLPRAEIIDLCNLHFNNGWRVLLFTGRPNLYRDLTSKWLEKHQVHYHDLFMRPDDQWFEPDYKVKQQMIDQIDGEIHLAVDDRDQAVAMWRKNGIVCLQCAEGNF